MHFRRDIKRNVSVKELPVCVTTVGTTVELNMSSGISKWRVFLGKLSFRAGIRQEEKSYE